MNGKRGTADAGLGQGVGVWVVVVVLLLGYGRRERVGERGREGGER